MHDSVEAIVGGYTKIDISEAHINAAIGLFFADSHPAPIHLLAASALSMMTSIGSYTGVDTFFHMVSDGDRDEMRRLSILANRVPNFMKHADRDPEEILSGFTDRDNDDLLFVAAHDFGQIASGTSIEMQVFQAWHYAIYTKKVSEIGLKYQSMIRRCIALFPGIRSREREGQKDLGRVFLETARHNEEFKMEISRTVKPSRDDADQ